jgi:hypothetical protein
VWVSFCKHYGRGNDAVLNYLSRYVFRTAISNARILGMDQVHRPVWVYRGPVVDVRLECFHSHRPEPGGGQNVGQVLQP